MNATEAVIVGTNSTTADVVSHGTLLAFGTLNAILCSIAIVLSSILILATTIPLLSPARRKQYSTYNLYLAYFSIPDLAVNVFILYLTILHTPWVPDDDNNNNGLWFLDYSWDDAVYPLCATANLYTNAFVTFEIYKLMKNSSLRKRYYPPTIGEVTKHAMMSYSAGLFIFVLDFFVVADHLDNNTLGVSPSMLKVLHLLYWAASWAICILIPLSVWIVVSIMIFCQGLIESTRSLYEGRLRILTLFFMKFVFLDVLVWLPCSISYTIQWLSNEPRTEILAYNTSLLFSGIQVVVNFWSCLSKPDTRQLIVDLLTGAHCRRRGGEDDPETNEADLEESRRRRDPFLRSLFLRTRSRASESTIPVSLLLVSQKSATQHSQTQSQSEAFEHHNKPSLEAANEELQQGAVDTYSNGTSIQDLDDRDKESLDSSVEEEDLPSICEDV